MYIYCFIFYWWIEHAIALLHKLLVDVICSCTILHVACILHTNSDLQSVFIDNLGSTFFLLFVLFDPDICCLQLFFCTEMSLKIRVSETETAHVARLQA